MEAAVNGGGGNCVFAVTIDANYGMVAVASSTTAQSTMAAAIPAATIG
jgi:hypothetical protein